MYESKQDVNAYDGNKIAASEKTTLTIHSYPRIESTIHNYSWKVLAHTDHYSTLKISTFIKSLQQLNLREYLEFKPNKLASVWWSP